MYKQNSMLTSTTKFNIAIISLTKTENCLLFKFPVKKISNTST